MKAPATAVISLLSLPSLATSLLSGKRLYGVNYSLRTGPDWAADADRCILNIGGIANVTLLPASGTRIIGFDTGPGNTLMDAWSRRHQGLAYDESGRWAARGRADDALLEFARQYATAAE